MTKAHTLSVVALRAARLGSISNHDWLVRRRRRRSHGSIALLVLCAWTTDSFTEAAVS